MEKKYYMGIDVGSTTIKIYITDQDDNCIYSKYERLSWDNYSGSTSTTHAGQ